MCRGNSGKFSLVQEIYSTLTKKTTHDFLGFYEYVMYEYVSLVLHRFYKNVDGQTHFFIKYLGKNIARVFIWVYDCGTIKDFSAKQKVPLLVTQPTE